jgi:hypothetical protein
MRSTTWTTDLTMTTDPAILGDIRLWLKRNDEIVPSRDADVVAKYLRLAIDATNQWGGVILPLTINRPRPAVSPWEWTMKGKRPRTPAEPVWHDSIAKQLALGSFGLLVMLALYLAFAG